MPLHGYLLAETPYFLGLFIGFVVLIRHHARSTRAIALGLADLLGLAGKFTFNVFWWVDASYQLGQAIGDQQAAFILVEAGCGLWFSASVLLLVAGVVADRSAHPPTGDDH